MKLVIISHTQHYTKSDGTLVGWGPTITEINHLTQIFEHIYHVAALVDTAPPKSAIPYNSDNITFVPIKRVGGKSFRDKIGIILQMPEVVSKVNNLFQDVDIFQLRAPTGMGVYLIPYLTFLSSKKGWFKYAGNWKEENASFGFTFQRWLLANQKRKVTINGAWRDQPKQCISFENPCLLKSDRLEGKKIIETKEWDAKRINFCFVGTFYKRKGVDKILEVLSNIDTRNIESFYFVGGDGEIEMYKARAKEIDCNIEFTGFLPKDKIIGIYKKCDFIVLPSDNEGFPKVIGEATNYGCIPIVSNVSCIGQYIQDLKNGFLIEPNTGEKLKTTFEKSFELSSSEFENMMIRNYDLAEKFTYEYYNQQLKDHILND